MADNPGKASGATNIGTTITDQDSGVLILGLNPIKQAVPIGVSLGDRLKTEDFYSPLLELILLELKLISLKLDCLQPNDESLDKNDLDNLEQ